MDASHVLIIPLCVRTMISLQQNMTSQKPSNSQALTLLTTLYGFNSRIYE